MRIEEREKGNKRGKRAYNRKRWNKRGTRGMEKESWNGNKKVELEW